MFPTKILPGRIICFDLVATIAKTIQELELTGFEDLLSRLVRFSSIAELETDIGDLVEKSCNAVASIRSSRDTLLVKQILEYVHRNYTKKTFCLEEVADRFNLSLSHLSRFFKEHTGETFSSHLITLRLDKMKKQLVSGNKSIKTIVEEIGYSDVPNCIRTFRRKTGVTPGTYRRLYTRKTPAEEGVTKI